MQATSTSRFKPEYDAKNMPVVIEDYKQSTLTEFGYDANGVRTWKTVLNADGSESTTYYISPAYEIRRETTGNNTVDHTVKSIFAGTIRIGQIESTGTEQGELTYLAQDHLGSTAAVVDRNGNVVEGAADVDYQPFGLPRPGSPALPANVTRRYTGQEWDASTNLYNYNARLYNPVMGMFITPDSIIQNLYDPQLLNRYAYVRNNPIIYTDPSGHVVPMPPSVTIKIELDEELDELKEKLKEAANSALDDFQTTLDAVGLFCDPVDIVNAGISAGRGNWGDAALRGAAMIPVVGVVATGGKIVDKASGAAKLSQGGILQKVKSFFGGLLNRVKGTKKAAGEAGEATVFSKKINAQLDKRGWTQEKVLDTIDQSFHTSPAMNKTTGGPATAYFSKEGAYVVRDNATGNIIQVSNRLDPNWVPDPTILNPYIP